MTRYNDFNSRPCVRGDAIIELVQLAIDDGWDADAMQSIVDQFSN